MAAQGVDVNDEEAVFRYSVLKWKHMMSECNRLLFSYHPDASVYYNGTTKLNTPNRNVEFRMYEHNTQHDLEDLPTTWGGYDKLPLRARLFANTGAPMVAMSGKFHTSWGEFGGYKHPDALRYEAAAMIAFGVACNFGDQLHPLGEMELDTYRAIGQAFEYVEQIEAYGIGPNAGAASDGGMQPASNLGLWRTGSEADDEGTARMLLETQTDFCVVDPEAGLAQYDVIVLTGNAGLSHAHAETLNRYVQAGGRLLVLGESALDADKTGFLLDVGATYLGPGQYDVDYTVPGAALGQGWVASPFLNDEAALRVQPHAGTEVLAAIHEPYFSRTYARYCSHRNTPYRPEAAEHPAAVRKGNVILLTHRLGKLYFDLGARLHRDLFIRALGLLHTAPMVRTELPSAGRVSLLHQVEPGGHSASARYVAHLLYAPPLQRGGCLVIEDMPPLYEVPLTLRVPEQITRAYLVPSGQELAVERGGHGTSEGDVVRVTVPEVRCHQAVVFEHA
jgi:hypothetical protein